MPPRRLADASRAVDADTGNCHDVALARNGHVDGTGRCIDKPVQFGCRFVAERGAPAGGEHRCPQPRASAGRSREGRIYTRVDRPPSVAADSIPDHVSRESGPEGLRAGDNTGLDPGQVAQSRGELTVHAAQCGGQAPTILADRQRSWWIRAMWSKLCTIVPQIDPEASIHRVNSHPSLAAARTKRQMWLRAIAGRGSAGWRGAGARGRRRLRATVRRRCLALCSCAPVQTLLDVGWAAEWVAGIFVDGV